MKSDRYLFSLFLQVLCTFISLFGLGCGGENFEDSETPAVPVVEQEPVPGNNSIALPGFTVSHSPSKSGLDPATKTLEARGAKLLFREDQLIGVDWQGAKIHNLDLEVLTEIPTLERLYLARTSIDHQGFVYLASLPNLKRLALWRTPIKDHDLQFLANAKKLEVLDLSRTRIDGSGLGHLAGCENLRELNLESTFVTADHLEELAKIRSLERINLMGCSVSGVQIAPLQKLPHLKSVQFPVTPESLPILADFPNLRELTLRPPMFQKPTPNFRHISKMKSLERFIASGESVRLPLIESIAKCPNLREVILRGSPRLYDADIGPLSKMKNLRLLDAWDTNLTVAGLRPLLESHPRLKLRYHSIAVLELGSAFGAMGIGSGLGSKPIPRVELDANLQVRAMRLDDARVFTEAIRLIASKLSPEALQVLSLNRTKTTNEMLQLIPVPENLRELSLAKTGVTAAGLKKWGNGQYPELSHLEILDLRGCHLSDECLAWIATLSALKSLKLDSATGITVDGWRALRKHSRWKQLGIFPESESSGQPME